MAVEKHYCFVGGDVLRERAFRYAFMLDAVGIAPLCSNTVPECTR